MTPVVALMIWTYAALVLGWWVGRHWDCTEACSRWCVSDRKKVRRVSEATRVRLAAMRRLEDHR